MMDMCCGDEVKGIFLILNYILFLGFLEKPENQKKEKTNFFPCRAYIYKKSFQTFTLHLFI